MTGGSANSPTSQPRTPGVTADEDIAAELVEVAAAHLARVEGSTCFDPLHDRDWRARGEYRSRAVGFVRWWADAHPAACPP